MLPCLSGLARRFHSAGAGTYLAGLWLEDLPMGLSWRPPSFRGSTVIAPYRGPSWSWVSIAYPQFGERGKLPERDTILTKTHLEILEVGCKAKGKDPFGEVSLGCFTMVAAPILELRWNISGLSGNSSWDLNTIDGVSSMFFRQAWLQVDYDSQEVEEVRRPRRYEGGVGNLVRRARGPEMPSLFALFVVEASCGGKGPPGAGAGSQQTARTVREGEHFQVWSRQCGGQGVGAVA